MDEDKKNIRRACKRAFDYTAWRNPFGVWFVTLYDENKEAIGKFQFANTTPKYEKDWIWGLIDEIDERKRKRNEEEE